MHFGQSHTIAVCEVLIVYWGEVRPLICRANCYVTMRGPSTLSLNNTRYMHKGNMVKNKPIVL